MALLTFVSESPITSPDMIIIDKQGGELLPTQQKWQHIQND